MNKPPALPDSLRETLPPEVQVYLAAVDAYLVAVEARLTELEVRLNQSSQNSSRPPSSDPPNAPPRSKKPARSARQRGGQLGHAGHHRALKASSQVDSVVEHRPTHCAGCQTAMPSDTATVGDLLAEMFAVPLSDASVVGAWEHVSAALAAPYAEAQTLVEAAAHAHIDATGWKQAGQRRWLWVAVTAWVTLFRLAATRRRAELTRLVGTTYQGRVTSDRFAAYAHLAVERRQVCWTPRKRALLGFSQGPYCTDAWVERTMVVEAQVFALWHRFKRGAIDRIRLLVAMRRLRNQFAARLMEGLTWPWYKVRGFCAEVLKLEPALWTFVSAPGVEPTNTIAERALRPAVLWRKGSFGSDSESGLQFVERLLTVTATCRRRQRPLLPFLSQAVSA